MSAVIPSGRNMLSSSTPKSGWVTPNCFCIAAEVRPTLWPFTTAPAAVQAVTCAS
jgi:hypothetical protein